MKKNLLTLLLATTLLVGCDSERVQAQATLPLEAQTLLSTHFADRTVSLVIKNRDWLETQYEVVLADGAKLEFNRSGAWTEIACRPALVPQTLIPQPIMQQIETRFPSIGLVEISREGKRYEVKLANGVELGFNRKYQLVEYDD